MAGFLLVLGLPLLSWALKARRDKVKSDAMAMAIRGNGLIREGKYEEGLAMLDQALEVCPDDAEINFFRAPALYRLHRLAEAESALDTSLKLRPGFPEARISRSLVRLARGDYSGANADAEAVVLAHPMVAMFLLTRAAVRAETGDVDGAQSDLEHASKLESPGVERGDVLVMKGGVEVRICDFEAAAKTLDEAFGLNPNHLDLRAWRSAARAFSGDLKGAEDDARSALAIQGVSPFPHLAMAQVFAARGSTREAEESLRQAEFLMPGGSCCGLKMIGRVRETLERRR